MAQTSQVYGGDEINAIIFDPGAAWTRVGWSAEDGPSIAYSTNYGARDGQAIYGDESTYMVKPNTEIRNPLKDSVVEDWENAKGLWTSALSDASPYRNTDYLTESPLLMTEPFWNSREAQMKSMEFALNDLQCPGFFLAKSPVLALFAAGRGSGIVIDAGAQTLSVTPVLDGLCLYKPAQRSRHAGNYWNEQIKPMLNFDIIPGYEIKSKTATAPGESPQFERKVDLPEGVAQSFRDYQVSRILEQFRESMVQVSETPFDAKAMTNLKPRTFEFPDGRQVQLAGERYTIGETLFKKPNKTNTLEKADAESNSDTAPKNTNHTETDKSEEPATNESAGPDSAMDVDKETETEESNKKSAEGSATKKAKTSQSKEKNADITLNDWSVDGVSEMVVNCLKACDVDARANLANNIVVTGGASLTQGFTERINQDLQREFPMLKIRIFASGNMVERKNGSWIGGSILASLGTFHQLWVTKQEYEEVGAEQLVVKRFR